MKLMTQEIKRALPPLYSQEDNPDPTVVAHFFNPTGQGDWYITEASEEDGDTIMFGLCVIQEAELGYVSLGELASTRVRYGLGIERDEHWIRRPLSMVREGVERRMN